MRKHAKALEKEMMELNETFVLLTDKFTKLDESKRSTVEAHTQVRKVSKELENDLQSKKTDDEEIQKEVANCQAQREKQAREASRAASRRAPRGARCGGCRQSHTRRCFCTSAFAAVPSSNCPARYAALHRARRPSSPPVAPASQTVFRPTQAEPSTRPDGLHSATSRYFYTPLSLRPFFCGDMGRATSPGGVVAEGCSLPPVDSSCARWRTSPLEIYEEKGIRHLSLCESLGGEGPLSHH